MKIEHRGTDPEAIAIGESLGLSFDGMQEDYYQFTVQQGPEKAKGITFYVKNLSEVESRLKDKLKEFGISQMTEDDKWQAMMVACRRMCKALGIEFAEPEYLNWTIGRRYYDDLRARLRGKKMSNNPVDRVHYHPFSKIRGEVVRLKTDLEGKQPYLFEAFRESVEGTISQMRMCNLRGALDQVDFASVIASTFRLDFPRVNDIETQLKDLIVELAVENCECKLLKED